VKVNQNHYFSQCQIYKCGAPVDTNVGMDSWLLVLLLLFSIILFKDVLLVDLLFCFHIVS